MESRLSPIAPTDLAWAAGIIDGEGCIWTRWPKRSNVCVEVKMIHKPTIIRLSKIFGGRVSEAHERRRGRRTQWRWWADTRVAQRVLDQTIPFLVTKRMQARCALGLIESSSRTAEGRAKRDEWKAALQHEKGKSYDPVSA